MEPPTGKLEIRRSRIKVSKWKLQLQSRDLLTKKTEYDLPFAIEKSDFVALVSSTSWEKSFANKRTNRKVVLERG